MELNLARDIKGNMKSFYKYTGNKRKTGENMGPFPSDLGNLVTQDMGKPEVLNVFFVSVFTSKTVPETRGKAWSKENLPERKICPWWIRMRSMNP